MKHPVSPRTAQDVLIPLPTMQEAWNAYQKQRGHQPSGNTTAVPDSSSQKPDGPQDTARIAAPTPPHTPAGSCTIEWPCGHIRHACWPANGPSTITVAGCRDITHDHEHSPSDILAAEHQRHGHWQKLTHCPTCNAAPFVFVSPGGVAQ